MGKTKITFSREEEDKLIDMVRARPWIYKKSHKDYKDVVVKKNTWEKIGELLEKSADDCESNWKALRDQFMGYRRKIVKATGSAAGAPPYFRHSSAMQFCKDQDDNESQFCNVEGGALSEGESLSLTEGPGNLMDLTEENVDNLKIGDDEVLPTSALPKDNTPRSHSKFGKKRKLDDFEERMLRAVENSSTPVQVQDEYDLFCKAIAPKLRKIGSRNEEMASQVQMDIFKILFDAENSLNNIITFNLQSESDQ